MTFFYRPKTLTGISVTYPQIFAEVMMANGFWPTEDNDDDDWLPLKRALYWIYGWMMFYIDTFITFCELAYFLNNITDVVKAVESLCTSMIALFIVFRNLHIRFVMDELKRMLKLFGEKVWISRDDHPFIVENCDRVMRPVFLIFVLMFNVLVIYCILPVIYFFKNNQSLQSPDKHLPYSMLFPYNVQDKWNYLATYVGAIITGYVTISHFYAFDALLFMFVAYLCGQFQILHSEILRLIPECHADWLKRYASSDDDGTHRTSIGSGFNCVAYDDNPDNGRIKILQDMYTKRLHELAARHNELISFCNQLNDLISFPLLLNIVNSTFLICFCGFEFVLSGTSSFSEFSLFSSFFLSVVLQLYVVCSCGSLLIKYSLKTANYLYICNWEGGQISKNSPLLLKPDDMEVHLLNAKLPLWKRINYYPADKDFRKKILFMILRSQRPVQLSAMKFTTLSLESFSKILSSSMSYFALLNTFLDKQK